jgi:hypothetical protein
VKSSGKLPLDFQSRRASKAGIGERTQRILDSLARSRPDLLAEVQAGRMSAHAAAVEAGIVKPTTTVRIDNLDAVARFAGR